MKHLACLRNINIIHHKLTSYFTRQSSRYCTLNTLEARMCEAHEWQHILHSLAHTAHINSHFRSYTITKLETQWTFESNITYSMLLWKETFICVFDICLYFCQGMPGPKGDKVCIVMHCVWYQWRFQPNVNQLWDIATFAKVQLQGGLQNRLHITAQYLCQISLHPSKI